MSAAADSLLERNGTSEGAEAGSQVALSGRVFLKLGRRFAFALVAAAFLFARQIAAWTRDSNRFYARWLETDGIAIVLDILLLAVAAVAVDSLLRWKRTAAIRGIYRQLYLLVIATGVIALIPGARQHPGIARAAWWVCAGCVALLYLPRFRPLQRPILDGALWLTPLVPILMYRVLSLSPYGAVPTEPRGAIASHGQTPIIILLLDEWSYLRATSNGHFINALPNVRRIAGESLDFHAAQTAGGRTVVSIPKLLFQEDAQLKASGGRIWMGSGNQRVESREHSSLFTLARSKGYRTGVIGFYMPYSRMLSGQLDAASSSAYEPRGQNLADKMMLSLLWNSTFLAGPPIDPVVRVTSGAECSYWRDLTHGIVRKAVLAAREGADDQFMFVHLPVPHPPFVFNADGTFRGDQWRQDPVDYMGQMGYADRVVGEITDALRASGRYDKCLLVITSDHAWRSEVDSAINDVPGSRFHVPLLIKWPGEHDPHEITKRFSHLQLGQVLELAMRGGTVNDAVRLLDRIPAAPLRIIPDPGGEPLE